MAEPIRSARELSPQKLLAGFSKGHIILWITVAAAVHVVVIGLLSVGYIRDRWIDPEGAVARKAAAVAAQDALKKAAALAKTPPAVPAPTGTVAKTEPPAAAGKENPDEVPSDRTNAPVLKRITDKAQPGEIPKQPGELGISLEDTNPR